MEQKVVDKINRAHTVIREREEAFNERWKEFKREFYTNEVQMMVYTIIDATHYDYKYQLSNGYYLWITGKGRIYMGNSGGGCLSNLWIGNLFSNTTPKHDEAMIRAIETHAKTLKREEEALKVVSADAPDIIDNITQRYKEITENQIDALDDVLNMIGENTTPIRHIKVTVEWI